MTSCSWNNLRDKQITQAGWMVDSDRMRIVLRTGDKESWQRLLVVPVFLFSLVSNKVFVFHFECQIHFCGLQQFVCLQYELAVGA
ncbi:hypothetical protein AHiyo6_00920 [Arthrobacter sp. Hiyo6]|nr:hypothetical protein AHiyo6_00920 [Arthrobacter sp. Hiyo6]